MDFNEHFVKARKYFDDTESLYTVGDKAKKIFLTALKSMEIDLSKESTCGDRKEIGKALQIMREIVLFKKHGELFLDFCRTFLDITWNWNSCVGKKENLNLSIHLLLRHINSVLSYDDLLNAVETVANKLDGTKWEPPSFELAGHYFEMVK
jgi:hypothetical protein